MILVLKDVPGRNASANHGQRIHIGMAADNGAGIQNAVAANLGPVAKNGSHFAKAGRCILRPVMNHDIGAVGLNVGCNGAGAHVCMKAQNGIADIVVVRHLALIEQNNILKLAGISDNAALARPVPFRE